MMLTLSVLSQPYILPSSVYGILSSEGTCRMRKFRNAEYCTLPTAQHVCKMFPYNWPPYYHLVPDLADSTFFRPLGNFSVLLSLYCVVFGI